MVHRNTENLSNFKAMASILKQGILTRAQQGDALCTVHCDIATHGSLLGLLMLYDWFCVYRYANCGYIGWCGFLWLVLQGYLCGMWCILHEYSCMHILMLESVLDVDCNDLILYHLHDH